MPPCLVTVHEPDCAYSSESAVRPTFGQWLRSDFQPVSRCPLSPCRARLTVQADLVVSITQGPEPNSKTPLRLKLRFYHFTRQHTESQNSVNRK